MTSPNPRVLDAVTCPICGDPFSEHRIAADENGKFAGSTVGCPRHHWFDVLSWMHLGNGAPVRYTIRLPGDQRPAPGLVAAAREAAGVLRCTADALAGASAQVEREFRCAGDSDESWNVPEIKEARDMADRLDAELPPEETP